VSVLPALLYQLAERLRVNGAQFSPRTLELLSAAMSFLQAIGNSLDDDVAIAAYAASQLMSDDAKEVAIALKVSPDFVPPLAPTNFAGLPFQLGQVLARADRQRAVVAATVLYSWYARAAKAGDERWLATSRETARTATLEGSKNQELARTLGAEMDKVLTTPRPAPVSGDHVFSISIDLAGSTDAKTRVMNSAQGNAERINKLNERIYRDFCGIERKFYASVVSRYRTSGAIDLSKFFTVKGIGDEIWILCDVAEQDIPRVGQTLIDAAIEIAVQSVQFLATQNDDDQGFDPDFDHGKIEPINSPLKVFIDVVSHASSLGSIRDEELIKAIPALLKEFHRREPHQPEIAHVVRRLGLSSYEPVGWWAFREFRTDYIGHEIDRFFRTTKAAIPGTVTIGESMARKMGLGFKPVTRGIHRAFTTANTPLMGSIPGSQDPVHACIRTLNHDQLKGIGYAYGTYTLFAPRSLNAIYVKMAADRKNGFAAMPYDETEKLIPPDTVEELVQQIIKARAG